MAGDHLSKAFAAADRMVAVAKAADLPAIISGAAGGIGGSAFDPETRITNAAEQYRHNRGWVHACVRLVSQRVAGQRICVASDRAAPSADVMLTKAMGERPEPLPSHPVLDLLSDPWDLGVAWSMITATVASLELTGRALWYVTEENGRPTIFPVPISWLENVDRKRTKWTIRLPGAAATIDIPGDRVVYFFYPDPANPWGALSPLQAIAGAVLADESITQTQWRTFTQGQFPGLILTVGKMPPAPGMTGMGPRHELTPEQKRQIIEACRKIYSGVINQGEPLILDAIIESVTKLTFTPAELDFLNSGKFTKSKILQGFGVSPILLGEVEGANRASATVADEIFCANKINPLIDLLSQTLTAWLGPMFAADGERLKIWIEPAVPHDPEMRFKHLQLACSKGAVRKNEIRIPAGLPPLRPEEGGDDFVSGGGSPIAVDPADAIDPAAAAAVKAIASSLNPYGARLNDRSTSHLEKAARGG
jgi:HK97 family phage portal protein